MFRLFGHLITYVCHAVRMKVATAATVGKTDLLNIGPRDAGGK